jgi:hypothetical protein
VNRVGRSIIICICMLLSPTKMPLFGVEDGKRVHNIFQPGAASRGANGRWSGGRKHGR